MAIRIDNSEAKNRLTELKDSISKLRAELKQLDEDGQSETDEYKAKKKALDGMNESYRLLRKEAGLTGLTYTELRKGVSQLRREMNNAIPGTEKWRELREDYLLTKNRMRELEVQARDTRFSVSKLADGFNRYAAIGASVIASLTGVALTARKCVDEYAQMEEAQSQVIKYTGMTKEETEALNESFKQMDTRTPREELNRLAGEAGKLGISSRDQVLEFVEAADMINVALGEDLGEDAVKNIGKLSQMFGDGSRTLKEDMLAIGSAVNQVAQSSSASEPYLVEFTARMGGVAKQANLAVTDVMGFASALDQNMLRSEMASTALQSLILKIYQEPAKFAKLAGLDVQEFVNLVNTDVNEALLQFLGTLGKMGGMAQMSPILKEMKLSGAEAAGVISALAGNIDQVRREQESANQAFIDGTSIIKENKVQNSTVQAELDKAKERFKDIRIELGEQLLPVMKYMVSTGSLTVKGLKEIVSFLIKYKKEIIIATSVIAAYTVAVKGASVIQAAWTTVVKGGTLAMRAFNTAVKSNPLGLIASLLAGAVTAMALFRKETKQTSDEQQALNEKLEQYESLMKRINRLKQTDKGVDLMNAEQVKARRASLESMIKELDDLMVEEMATQRKWYQDQVKEKMAWIGDDKNLEKAVIGGLKHQLKERMMTYGAYAVERKKLADMLAKLPKVEDDVEPAGGGDDSELADAEAALKSRYQNELNLLKEKYLNQQLAEEQYNKALYDAEVKYLASRKLLLEQYGQDSSEIQGQIYDKMIAEANRLNEEAKKVDANRQSDLLGQVELEYQQEQSRLKQAYLDGDIRTQEDYQERMLEAERSYLEQRRDMLAAFGMDTSAEDGRLQDMDLKDKESGRKQQRKSGFAAIANTTDLDQQLNLLQAMYDADLINYEEYQETKTQLTEAAERQREEITKTSLDVIGQAASAASQLIQALQDAEINKIESRYDKQIEAAKAAGKDTTKLEEQKEAAVNEVKRKYADKQFAASVLQVTATTAVTAMEAYKAMAGIPFIGPALGAAAAAAALAAGAAQIAVAKQQRDEAKGLKSGGYSDEYVDGYTRKGNPDDVAGVIPVHKNEFVANHEAVGNPAVKQFLDVFDVAQKKGTIRMLNTTQILEQVRTRSGRYSGGYTYDNPIRPSATFSAELGQMTPEQRLQVIALLQENNRLLAVLCNKELVVDPRKVRDGIKRVETLERNVRR